ncbi:hypothetical protein [Salinimicrobium sp. HB62]|uniref:hypothetical protein n=1 Tax=Salinimicrobium sp. HB62 TaxID=3077781 RepID=UPI002D79CB6B|nr:hypothetical protein [Salinimicrobium sp. HB62]
MKRIFTLLLFISLIFSCVPEDHVLEIEIVNNTGQPVRDLMLSTAENRVSFKADNLPAGQDIEHTMQVKESFADGQYTFRFTRSNGKEESATGSYMEEGEGALKKTLVFDIREEGVNVEHKVLETE